MAPLITPQDRPRHLLFLISFLGLISVFAEAAPPIGGRKQAGPCIGMDCLHGILMHGDEAAGDDHKHQDIYEKLQEQDNLKGQHIGPDQGLVLGDAVETMHQDEHTGPEQQKNVGPNDAMTELHGVLMHGDSHHGIDHHHQDEKLTKAEENKVKDGPDPEALHGILMHGDSEQGHDHALEDQELQEPEHEGKVSKGGDPEAAMHGEDANVVHSHDNVHKDPEHEGIPSVGDLDAALHGDFNAKMETLGKPTPDDVVDFRKWNKDKTYKTASKDNNKDKDGGGGWGFTFPFISDSILNELDLMKRRYMKKFWGTEEDEVAYKEKDLRLEKPVHHDVADDLAAVGDTGPISHLHEHGHREEVTASGDKPRKDL